jgi:hypothetical protein
LIPLALVAPPFLLLLLLLPLLSLSLSLSLCAVCRGSLYIGTGADIDRRTQTKMTQTKQHGDDTDKETRGLDQDRHKRYTDKDAARHSDSKVSLKTNP